MGDTAHTDAIDAFRARFIWGLETCHARSNEERERKRLAPQGEKSFIESCGGEALYKRYIRGKKKGAISGSLFTAFAASIFPIGLDGNQIDEIREHFEKGYLQALGDQAAIDLTREGGTNTFEAIAQTDTQNALRRDSRMLSHWLSSTIYAPAMRNDLVETVQRSIAMCSMLQNRREDFGLKDAQSLNDALALCCYMGGIACGSQNNIQGLNAIIETLVRGARLDRALLNGPNDPRYIASQVRGTLDMIKCRLSLMDLFETDESRAISQLDATLLCLAAGISSTSSMHFRNEKIIGSEIFDLDVLIAWHAVEATQLREWMFIRKGLSCPDPSWVGGWVANDKGVVCEPSMFLSRPETTLWQLLEADWAAGGRTGLMHINMMMCIARSVLFSPALANEEKCDMAAELLKFSRRHLISRRVMSHSVWSDWYSSCAKYFRFAGTKVGAAYALDRVKDLQKALHRPMSVEIAEREWQDTVVATSTSNVPTDVDLVEFARQPAFSLQPSYAR